MLGRITFITSTPVPSLLAGWSIFLADDNVRLLFGHTAATVVSKQFQLPNESALHVFD